MDRLDGSCRRFLVLAALGVLGGPMAGCAISFDGYELDDDAGAAGSHAGSGGRGGSGGNGMGDASSGAAGAAGSSGAGGSGMEDGGPDVASGGSTASGGSAGSGGVTGGGGSAGAGGASGSGGSGGSGGMVDGGSGGAAGAGGSGGNGGTGGGTAGCPVLAGPPMIEVPIPAGAPGTPGVYCIDRTEVTNKQYADFLATSPSTAGQPSICTWNTSFAPETLAGNDNCPSVSAIYDVQKYPQNPVACIDWCDARQYCESVGKRLCGAFGGGAVPSGSGSDPKKDEWYAACSGGGAKKFPYADIYDGYACNTLEYGQVGSVSIASAVRCVGGYSGIFDMSGNVAEWEDACAGTSGAGDTCYARGGYWNSFDPNPPTATQSSAACGATPTVLGSISSVALTRGRRSREIGFRCCYDGK